MCVRVHVRTCADDLRTLITALALHTCFSPPFRRLTSLWHSVVAVLPLIPRGLAASASNVANVRPVDVLYRVPIGVYRAHPLPLSLTHSHTLCFPYRWRQTMARARGLIPADLKEKRLREALALDQNNSGTSRSLRLDRHAAVSRPS